MSSCCRAGNLCLFNVSGYAYMTKLTHLPVAVQWSKFLVCLRIKLLMKCTSLPVAGVSGLCYFHLWKRLVDKISTFFCGRSAVSISFMSLDTANWQSENVFRWQRTAIDVFGYGYVTIYMYISSCGSGQRSMLLPGLLIRLYDEMNTSSYDRVRRSMLLPGYGIWRNEHFFLCQGPVIYVSFMSLNTVISRNEHVFLS
jgi:hypothetical protein